MEQKYITIGSLKVTIQAFVLFLSGTITAAIVLIIMPSIWFVSVGMIVLSFVAAYVINCTVEGKCIIYSWTITVIIVLYFCFLIFLTLKERMGLRSNSYVMNVKVDKAQAGVQTNATNSTNPTNPTNATKTVNATSQPPAANSRPANARQNATRV